MLTEAPKGTKDIYGAYMDEWQSCLLYTSSWIFGVSTREAGSEFIYPFRR